MTVGTMLVVDDAPENREVLPAAPDDLKQADRPDDNFTIYLTKPFDLDERLAAIFGAMATCDETPTGSMASG